MTIGMRQSSTYRLAVGLALAAVLILIWVHGAVGIIGDSDDPANLMYVGVLGVGIIGAIVTRFSRHGMARALYATAVAQMTVTLIVLFAGLGFPPTPAWSLLILNGLLFALFAGSAWLFRRDSQALNPEDAAGNGRDET